MIKLIVDEYIGRLYKQNKRGAWRKFWQIGNAGIALDIADLLRKLGHKVEIEERRNHDESSRQTV